MLELTIVFRTNSTSKERIEYVQDTYLYHEYRGYIPGAIDRLALRPSEIIRSSFATG